MKRMQSTAKAFGIVFAALLMILVPAACGPTGDAPPGDGDGDGDGDDTPPMCEDDASPCKRNIDCEAGAICTKDEGAGVDDWGCCERILCTEDAHCQANEVCDQRRGICVPADLCD